MWNNRFEPIFIFQLISIYEIEGYYFETVSCVVRMFRFSAYFFVLFYSIEHFTFWQTNNLNYKQYLLPCTSVFKWRMWPIHVTYDIMTLSFVRQIGVFLFGSRQSRWTKIKRHPHSYSYQNNLNGNRLARLYHVWFYSAFRS